MKHHRTPEFGLVHKNVNAKLRKVFLTDNPVVTFLSSGTGAMEASVVNFLSKGDKALVISGGKFGGRFEEICASYGVLTVEYEVNWGESADPGVLRDILSANKDIKVVYSTLCETSTGALNDIKGLAREVSKTDAIIVVDAISGLAADEMQTDKWGVDVVIGASQKGLMVPPGLSFLSVSEKAERLMAGSELPKYYLDLSSALRSHANDDTPWTPAITLIQGMEEALEMILSEGLDAVIGRHARLAGAVRAAIRAMGLELFAREPSNALTAVKIPDRVDGNSIVEKLRDSENITIPGGQSKLKGKIIRIGHLGYVDDYDIMNSISALEIVLDQTGHAFNFGDGIMTAQKYLREKPFIRESVEISR